MIPTSISEVLNFLRRPLIAQSSPTDICHISILEDNHYPPLPFGIPRQTSFEDIPPFFEPNSAPSFNVSTRTEIPKKKLPSRREVGTGPVRRERSSNVRFNPYKPPSANNKGNKKEVVESDFDSSSDVSSSSSINSESEEDDLISKPVGEVNRPGRGGYNLEKALGWSTKEYRRVKVRDRCYFIDDFSYPDFFKEHVKKLCVKHLVLSKSFSSQTLTSIATVQSQVIVFPHFERGFSFIYLFQCYLLHMTGF